MTENKIYEFDRELYDEITSKLVPTQTCFKYKEYAQKYLPQKKTLVDYEVPDFNYIEGELDELAQLELYLKELFVYKKHLTKSARLRQEHYLEFIKNKVHETPKHEHWRIGMNKIAEDSEEKYQYWLNVKNEMLSNIIEINNNDINNINTTTINITTNTTMKRNRRKRADTNLYVQNVDYNKGYISSTQVKTPGLTPSEKRRRKKEKIREKQLNEHVAKEKIQQVFEEANDYKRKIIIEEDRKFLSKGGIGILDIIKDYKKNPYALSPTIIKAFAQSEKHNNDNICLDYNDRLDDGTLDFTSRYGEPQIYKLARLCFKYYHYHDFEMNTAKGYEKWEELILLFHSKEFRRIYAIVVLNYTKHYKTYCEHHKNKTVKDSRDLLLAYTTCMEGFYDGMEEIDELYKGCECEHCFSNFFRQSSNTFLDDVRDMMFSGYLHKKVIDLKRMLKWTQNRPKQVLEMYPRDSEKWEFIFMSHVDMISEEEHNKLVLDSIVWKQFTIIRSLMCKILNLNEQVFIDNDTDFSRLIGECCDKNCPRCIQKTMTYYYCKKCHKRDTFLCKNPNCENCVFENVKKKLKMHLCRECHNKCTFKI